MARVGIDLDGVIYDFQDALKKWLVRTKRRTAEQCTPPQRWEFYEDWGLTLQEFLAEVQAGVIAGSVFRQGEPINDAKAQLQRLHDAGHRIVIITDRKFKGAINATYHWLTEYGLPYDEAHFTANKTRVPVDYMIDDKPENYDALSKAGVEVWLQSRPWNRHYQDHSWSVNSLRDYVDSVLGTEKLKNLKLEEQTIRKSIDNPPADKAEVRTVSSTGGEKGVKLARYDLIPADALRQVAEHYGKGAEKYDARNWERGYEWSKSFGALMRHAWQFWGGEDIDPETGSHHGAAIAFHALALMEFAETHREFDDRPTTSSRARDLGFSPGEAQMYGLDEPIPFVQSELPLGDQMCSTVVLDADMWAELESEARVHRYLPGFPDDSTDSTEDDVWPVGTKAEFDDTTTYIRMKDGWRFVSQIDGTTKWRAAISNPRSLPLLMKLRDCPVTVTEP